MPRIGWIAWSAADAALYVWNGTAWAPVGGGGGVIDGDKGAIIVSGGGTSWTIDPAANVQVNRIGIGGAVPFVAWPPHTSSPSHDSFAR